MQGAYLTEVALKKKGDFIPCSYKCVPFIVAAVLSGHPKASDFGKFTFQINIDTLLKRKST